MRLQALLTTLSFQGWKIHMSGQILLTDGLKRIVSQSMLRVGAQYLGCGKVKIFPDLETVIHGHEKTLFSKRAALPPFSAAGETSMMYPSGKAPSSVF